MAAVWLRARSEWRRRRVALAQLAVLITLAGGVTLAAAGGARRADSSLDRWQAGTNAGNVLVGSELDRLIRRPTDVREIVGQLPAAAELADEIAAVPGVRGVQIVTYVGVQPGPGADFFAWGLGDERGDAPREVFVSGRAADPTAADEVVVNEAAEEEWGVHVGSSLTVASLGRGQWTDFFGFRSGPPQGPPIDLHVVGVMRDIEAIADSPEPVLSVTAAFVGRWGDTVPAVVGGAEVNVDPRRVEDVIEALDDVGGGFYTAARTVDVSDFEARIGDTIDVEVAALWAFAVAAALAGLLVVVGALVRHMADDADARRIRRALGVTPRQELLGSLVGVAPALIVGLVCALVLAVAASPLLPRGAARYAEIDSGVRVDIALLFIGGVVLAALLAAIWGAAALVASLRTQTSQVRPRARPTAPIRFLPLVPALGARVALRGGNRRATGWIAVSAVAVGVAGIVAVGTIASSVHELLTTPALFGAPWDLETEEEPTEPVPTDRLAQDPDVSMIGALVELAANDGIVRAAGPGGEWDVEPYTLVVERGRLPLVLRAGRPPGPGEAAVGSEILDRLGARIGDSVVVHGHRGPVRLTVTGEVVNAGTDELDQGFYVDRETLESLRADCSPTLSDRECEVAALGVGVALRPGADREQAAARLQAYTPGLQPTARPSVVDNLAEIGSAPVLLGGFLALLAIAGLSHAVLVTARAARRDLAVLRVLGLRPSQAAGVLRWQAALLTVLGSAIGLTVGMIIGSLIWRRVAEAVGALVDTDIPVALLILTPLGGLALAIAVATVPGRRAARLHPSELLKAE